MSWRQCAWQNADIARTEAHEDAMNKTEMAIKLLRGWKQTDLTFGDGIISKAGETIKRYADSSLIIIGQGAIKNSGVLDLIARSLAEAGVKFEICERVEVNPSQETVYRIAYRLLANNFQSVFAVGGGSVMDAAKAACILASAKEGELQDYYGAGRVSAKIRRIMPLVLAPTTSGSGSEVTRFSVISDTRQQLKKMIADPAIYAHAALVDPQLTSSAPSHITRVSGLDAMTHLIEGYFNRIEKSIDPTAEQRGLLGMSLLFEALPRAIEKPEDGEARKMMSLASVLGGSMFLHGQAGGPHLNSFSWSTVMAHGEATAVMLPYYGAFYAPVIAEKIRTVSDLLGVSPSESPANDFAEGLFAFYRKIGFPTALREFPCFSTALIEKAVEDGRNNTMKLAAMPRPVPVEKSREILNTIIMGAYHGKLEEIVRI
jgi:alcohol dehydrogenase